ncbi:MAG: Spore Coat Protein domain [Pseudomonadota bacterium]|jgi:spore coat protein U-like protein
MRLSKLLAAALVAVPVLASAAEITGTFKVSAEVKPACSVSATDVVVATYDPTAAAATKETGTISVACTKKTAYKTGLTSANGWTLKGTGTDVLKYQIFQGATTTPWNDVSIWGATSTGKAAVGYTATVSIDPQQDVAVDVYADTVTVHVNY